MTRIFITLSFCGTALLGLSVFLGLGIGDAATRDPAVQSAVGNHMMIGLGGLIFAALVHAICFTYFMGTGRWIEETSSAYKLADGFFRENQTIKYRTLPGMMSSIILLVLIGAFGAAADPASAVGFKGWFGMTPATIHLVIVIAAIAVNLAANVHEFRSIERNGEIIESVMDEVRRIRTERGLPV